MFKELFRSILQYSSSATQIIMSLFRQILMVRIMFLVWVLTREPVCFQNLLVCSHLLCFSELDFKIGSITKKQFNGIVAVAAVCSLRVGHINRVSKLVAGKADGCPQDIKNRACMMALFAPLQDGMLS